MVFLFDHFDGDDDGKYKSNRATPEKCNWVLLEETEGSDETEQRIGSILPETSYDEAPHTMVRPDAGIAIRIDTAANRVHVSKRHW